MKEFVELPDIATARLLLGPNDIHLRSLRDKLKVKLALKDTRLQLEGEPTRVRTAVAALQRMVEELGEGEDYKTGEFREILAGAEAELSSTPTRIVLPGGRKLEAKSPGQATYLEAIHSHDITFASGPAGTGKTYLAVACAVAALKRNKIKRIVLARPAVEAGERLGFLPGDMQDKVDPYLRPLYDALHDFLPRSEVAQYLQTGVVEVAPLAFMRGRTLAHAFVILDEAQNTTPGQMKMFLTRMGASSKAVITGDDTQIDLANPEQSGLIHAMAVLKEVEGLCFIRLTDADTVRHRLVREIVRAYEADGAMS